MSNGWYQLERETGPQGRGRAAGLPASAAHAHTQACAAPPHRSRPPSPGRSAALCQRRNAPRGRLRPGGAGGLPAAPARAKAGAGLRGSRAPAAPCRQPGRSRRAPRPENRVGPAQGAGPDPLRRPAWHSPQPDRGTGRPGGAAGHGAPRDLKRIRPREACGAGRPCEGVGAMGRFYLRARYERLYHAALPPKAGLHHAHCVPLLPGGEQQGHAGHLTERPGFSTKFYTEQGCSTFCANHLPVFSVRDAIRFPESIKAFLPAPTNNLIDPPTVLGLWPGA